jgi:hypothetical protein
MYKTTRYLAPDAPEVDVKTGNTAYRLALGIAISAAALLFWAVMGVGVLGADGDSSDRIYTGVLAVAFIGALIARQPRGMAYAMFATALAQALVAVLALNAGMHLSPASSVAEIVGVNGVFVVLFGASGCLFWLAGRRSHAGAKP